MDNVKSQNQYTEIDYQTKIVGSFVVPKSSDWSVNIGNIRIYAAYGDEPNFIHRFLQKYMLGLVWKKDAKQSKGFN